MSTIHESVTEMEVKGMRLFASRTTAKDVVTISGSVLGGWNMLPRNKAEVPGLFAELLDAGTKKRSKNAFREALASRGIHLSFSSGMDRTHFHASCLPEDVKFTFEAIVESLTQASLSAKELSLAVERARGDLEQEKTNTGLVSRIALSQALYDKAHVNYGDMPKDRMAYLKKVTRADLLAFQKRIGRTGLVCAIVGDISPEATLEEVAKIVGKLPEGSFTLIEKARNTKAVKATEQLISVKNKTSIDVNLGVALPLTREDPLFIPFVLFIELLGGGSFTNHLTLTIRERDGLTYHVQSLAFGFAGGADGALRIYASFSPARFEESVEKLRREIAIFCKQGVSEQSLRAKQQELAAKYAIGLATTNGLASTLHSIGVEGKPLAYIDEYPDLLRSVTVEEIEEVLSMIPRKEFSLTAAGTFAKK